MCDGKNALSVAIMVNLALLVFFIAVMVTPVIWLALVPPRTDFTARDSHLFLIYLLLTIMVIGVIQPTNYHMIHSFTATLAWLNGQPGQSMRDVLLFPHIVAALASLFLGPVLFLKQYRVKYPAHHRFLGKLYVFGTLISAIIVLPLSLTNGGGLVGQVGFSAMACLWIIFTWEGYQSARMRDFVQHRRWMIRSYAMTFAFVHVNLTYGVLGVYHLLENYPSLIKMMQSMASWGGNLIIAECYLAATTAQGRFVSGKRFIMQLLRQQNPPQAQNITAISNEESPV